MFHKYHAAAWLALAVATLPNLAQAQDALVQKKALGQDGQPVLIEFSAVGRASARAAEGEQVIRRQLALGPNDQLRPARTETDQLGFSHQKFDQFYKGVKVEHATYTTHSRGGQVEALSGDYEKVEALSVVPSLSADAALARALAFVGAKKYMWQDAAEEAGLRALESDPAATYRPTGELVVVRDHTLGERGPLVLAWKFNVYAQVPVSRAYIYVDAQTGKVVLRDAIIKHATHATTAASSGTFATRYSGTQTSTTDSYNGSYRLRDASRGGGVQTYNAKRSNSYASPTDFTDADNNWSEYNNANSDDAALDAHWGAQAVYDYWKNVQGRNSYDNAGATIKSFVHFDDTPGDGVGFENAYWNGSVMTYGDGANTFKPLTALDVCAHEIGHAICQNTANLVYANESGGLNEGFSDIWGAVVENYRAPGKQTWLIGEDIIKPAGYTCLRSMSDPTGSGALSRCPAYYKGNLWKASVSNPDPKLNDNGGVHTNSGVLNYWFYLLSVGKSATNEAGNAFTVSGITIGKAANIAYRTESVYLSANSTFADARTYSIKAASDLYGAGSAEVIATTNAWYAVGVGAAYGGATPAPPTPPTTATYCASKGGSQAYEYIDLVKLGSINRSSKADGGYYDGTASTTSVAAGSSQTLSISAGFTGSAYTENWKVYIDYNQNGDFGDSGELVVSGSSSSAATLSATFTVPAAAKSGKTRLRVIMSDAAATTACGSYSYGETEDYGLTITGGAALAGGVAGPATLTGDSPALSGDAVLSLYPNPAAAVLTLALSSKEALTSVEVFDALGKTVSAARYQGNGQLDVSGLASGLYLLRASAGTQTFVQRFVKQ